MNARLWDRRNRSRTSIAISVAIHAAAFAGLATITFHYPLADFFDRPEQVQAVPVRYIPLERRPAAPPATLGRKPQEARALPPAAIPKAASIPAGVPAPAVPLSPATTALGAGGSAAVAGRDPVIGVGIRPGIPDGRLATNPLATRMPQTEGQMAERALAAIYREYLDSARAAAANAGREPGDWSWGGKDGEKWGWDKNGIHVGGVTIPNMVLAALPIPVTGNSEPVAARAREFVRSDIQTHAGLMTEDEFRAAVRRVRERVDRERRERMEKAAKKKQPDPPCCGL